MNSFMIFSIVVSSFHCSGGYKTYCYPPNIDSHPCRNWLRWSRSYIAFSLSDYISYTGQPVEVVGWEDSTGEYLLCITENRHGEFGNGSYQSLLLAQIYEMKNDKGRLVASFGDTTGAISNVGYLDDSFLIGDYNKDGKSEVYFFYDIDEGDSKSMILFSWNNGVVARISGRSPIYPGSVNVWEFVDSSDTLISKEQATFMQDLWKRYYTSQSEPVDCGCN